MSLLPYDFEVRVGGALTPGLTPTIAAAYLRNSTPGQAGTLIDPASAGYPYINSVGNGLYSVWYDKTKYGPIAVVVNANSTSSDPNEMSFTMSLGFSVSSGYVVNAYASENIIDNFNRIRDALAGI